MDLITLTWIFITLTTPLYPLIATVFIKILKEVQEVKQEIIKLRTEFNNHIKYLHCKEDENK